MTSRPSNRVLLWLSSVPFGWWVAAGFALVLGVSALFGGLEDADLSADNPPVVEVGEPIARDELTTVIHSLEVTDVSPATVAEPEEGETYLVLTATVTNNYSVSTITFTDLVAFEQFGEEMPPYDRVVLLSDGTTLPQAHPGVPIEVAWVWVIPDDLVVAGDTVRLTVMAKTLTVDGLVSYGSYWSTPEPTAWVDLEVAG